MSLGTQGQGLDGMTLGQLSNAGGDIDFASLTMADDESVPEVLPLAGGTQWGASRRSESDLTISRGKSCKGRSSGFGASSKGSQWLGYQ